MDLPEVACKSHFWLVECAKVAESVSMCMYALHYAQWYIFKYRYIYIYMKK